MLTCAETSGYIGTHTHIHADVSTHLDARRGRASLSSAWDRGEAPLSERGRVWSGRGWEGAETSTPLSPDPRARAHARTHALPVNGGSWKPLGPPGPARRLLLWCWRCSGGRAGVSRLESGRGSCGSSTARPAKRGAAPWLDLQGRAKGRRSARLLGRPEPTASGSGPYQPEGAGSPLISEATQGRAW